MIGAELRVKRWNTQEKGHPIGASDKIQEPYPITFFLVGSWFLAGNFGFSSSQCCRLSINFLGCFTCNGTRCGGGVLFLLINNTG